MAFLRQIRDGRSPRLCLRQECQRRMLRVRHCVGWVKMCAGGIEHVAQRRAGYNAFMTGVERVRRRATMVLEMVAGAAGSRDTCRTLCNSAAEPGGAKEEPWAMPDGRGGR
ncbi:hypothetical protein B0H19DRAFT_1077724 [Mycena capillaripes]|nr:hypothetical protein B0H19DRAFT_1077724 [Mycena capillaripes]